MSEAPPGVGKLPAIDHLAADGLFRAFRAGTIDEAAYALQRARSLFHAGPVEKRYGDVVRPGPRDATHVLRDLAARLDSLSGEELVRARRLLARPTDKAADPDGQGYTVDEQPPACSPVVCVHWVSSTVDAPPLTDTNPVTPTPDWVDTTHAVIQQVWDAEIGALGYRAPKNDTTSPNNGGSPILDVYLAQLGDEGIYGYCTTDDPLASPASGYRYFDVSSFCVLDNDFAPTEFPPPTSSGLPALQVTVAHEFFHAVQFAYDFLEDLWMTEGTATWIEDRLFDDVNDNFQYFAESPLRAPRVPLDLGRFGHPYGAWVFWRFLDERFATAADPGAGASVIRRAWEYADGSPAGPDLFAARAVGAAVVERGGRFRSLFAQFTAVNASPASFYEEGAAYPRARPSKRLRVGVGRPETARIRMLLDHLTERYVAFLPGRGANRGARLLVEVDLPRRLRGPAATLVVVRRSGAIRFVRFALNAAGDGRRNVGFGRGSVRRVLLVLTNASTRFRACFEAGSPFSCAGIPRDERQPFRFVARLRR